MSFHSKEASVTRDSRRTQQLRQRQDGLTRDGLPQLKQTGKRGANAAAATLS